MTSDAVSENLGDETWDEDDCGTTDAEGAADRLAGRRADGALVLDPAVVAGLAATGVIRSSMAGIHEQDLDRLMFHAHEGDGADGTFGHSVELREQLRPHVIGPVLETDPEDSFDTVLHVRRAGVSNTDDAGVQVRAIGTDGPRIMLRLTNQDAFDLALELLASARAAAVRHARDNPIPWAAAKHIQVGYPPNY